MRKSLVLLACLLAPAVTSATPETLVVCYPGGPVNAKEAGVAMNAMLRVIERVGQWPENSYVSAFTTKLDECRQQMADKKPKFAITSLGLFLELHAAQHLLPLVQPKIKGQTSEHYRIVAQAGKFADIAALHGKTLGGTVLEEQAFIGKIVLAGQYHPANFFVLKPSTQAIRALRALDNGELDAVLLNEQQYAGLAALNLANPPEVVFTSAEIPLMGVVADSARTNAEERARFSQALAGMCTDTEGKKLCDMFGVEAFVPVDAAVFAPMLKLWDEGK